LPGWINFECHSERSEESQFVRPFTTFRVTLFFRRGRRLDDPLQFDCNFETGCRGRQPLQNLPNYIYNSRRRPDTLHFAFCILHSIRQIPICKNNYEFINSFTTSPAIISPAVLGTKLILAGVRSPSFLGSSVE